MSRAEMETLLDKRADSFAAMPGEIQYPRLRIDTLKRSQPATQQPAATQARPAAMAAKDNTMTSENGTQETAAAAQKFEQQTGDEATAAALRSVGLGLLGLFNSKPAGVDSDAVRKIVAEESQAGLDADQVREIVKEELRTILRAALSSIAPPVDDDDPFAAPK